MRIIMYKIDELERQIIYYHDLLNLKAGWFALAAMAAYGLKENKFLCFCGFIVAMFFYAYDLATKTKMEFKQSLQFDFWNSSIASTITTLETEIQQPNLTDIEKNQCLQLLDDKCKTRLRILRNWKRNARFWTAWIFFGLCFFAAMFS